MSTNRVAFAIAPSSYVARRTFVSFMISAALLFPLQLPPLLYWNVIEFAAWFSGMLGLIVAGYAAQQYKPHIVFALCLTVSGICTFLFAISFQFGLLGVILNKCFNSFAKNGLLPAGFAILGYWTLPYERVEMTSNFMMCYYMATPFHVAAKAFSMHYDYGREGYEQFFGGCCLFWALMIVWLLHKTPHEDPKTVAAERNLFVQQESASSRISWCNVLNNVPFWSLTVVHICIVWKFVFFSNFLLPLIKSEFAVAAKELSTSCLFLAFALGLRMNHTITHCVCSNDENRRKIGIPLSLIMDAALLIVSYVIAKSNDHIVLLFVLSGGCFALGIGAANVFANFLELAPNHCSTLVVLTNLISFVFCAVFSLLLSNFYSNSHNTKMFRHSNFFLVMAAMNVVAAFVYYFRGSREDQRWNGPENVDLENIEPLPVDV